MALTKTQLLQGEKARKTVPIEALDGEVEIRPLTDGEFHEIQDLFVEAVTMNLDLSAEELQQKTGLSGSKLAEKLRTEIDVKKFTAADYQSNLLAAAYGLSVEEEWTPEEVAKLKPGAAEEIASEVYELSGAHPEQEMMLRRFRGVGTGSGDDQGTDAGSSAGSDASGADSGSENTAGRSVESDLPDGRSAVEKRANDGVSA